MSAAVSVLTAYMLPFLVGVEDWGNGQIVRVLFASAVFTVVAILVHYMAERLRRQIADVTALSDELRTTEAFAESIWDAITDAVIVTARDGRVVAWGPGARVLLGYHASQIGGYGPDEESGIRNITELVDPADRTAAIDADAALANLIRVGRSAGGGDGDLHLRNASGERVPVYLSCSERRDANGKRVGYIFVARDARYAREIARLKDEFVGTVSHELRTPLSSILGYLELVMEEDENLSEEQRRFLRVADRNAQRLLHLVGDLLFIAQVDGGKVPIERHEIDLGTIAAASRESILPVAARAGVAVEVDVSDPESGPVTITGDARRIGQAIDNLVSNAVKFTPKGGRITIDVHRDGSDAVVAVSDTGMGIPPEELSQLTERFFRSRMATRQAIKGVGLGLSITKAIVAAHGGTLSASSVVGEGTAFEIRIPV